MATARAARQRLVFVSSARVEPAPLRHEAKAFDQPLGRLGSPVTAFQRQHGHTAQTGAGKRAPELRAAIPEGRAHQDRSRVALRTERAKNALLAGLQFLGD